MRGRHPSWPLVGLLLLFGALAGLAYGTLSWRPRTALNQLSYAVREGLGLQKDWVALPGPDQAEGRKPVACPDPLRAVVLVTGGQSNASNAVPVLADTPPPDEVVVWFDGRCWPAADPVLGATGADGSLWPPLAAEVAAELDRPVLLVNGAIGGTQVGDWLDPRSGYRAALMGRVQEAQAAGFEPDLVLWHQGETDAGAERDMARVERRFGDLADGLLVGMPEARLYLFRASKCIGANRAEGVAGIRDAQTAVAESRDRVVPGMDTDALGNDFRWDTCHFNSLGRAAIVNEVAPEVADLLR